MNVEKTLQALMQSQLHAEQRADRADKRAKLTEQRMDGVDKRSQLNHKRAMEEIASVHKQVMDGIALVHKQAMERIDSVDRRFELAHKQAMLRMDQTDKQIRATRDLVRAEIKLVVKNEAAMDESINALINSQERTELQINRLCEALFRKNSNSDRAH